MPQPSGCPCMPSPNFSPATLLASHSASGSEPVPGLLSLHPFSVHSSICPPLFLLRLGGGTAVSGQGCRRKRMMGVPGAGLYQALGFHMG